MPDWLALYYDEPIALSHGEGCKVWDVEGNEYLDFFGGILTTISGHNVPEIIQAVKSQADKMLHSSTLYLIEPAIELAEEIARLVPIPDAKVFFCNSGTEANEAALLLATTYRRSNQIIALRNSYHGRSFAAMAVTGNRGWSASSLSPVQVSYVHGGYKFRSPFKDMSDNDYIDVCAQDLRDVIDTQTAGDVACFITEPIQGVGGFSVPPDGMFNNFKKTLDEENILFIADEVQTGWGRTGEHFWGIEAHDVVPDIMTFAKGLGNGLAIAGVAARSEIMDSIKANSISTFGGNPLSAAGALANIKYILDHNLQQNALDRGTELMEALKPLKDDVPEVGDVRGKGLMLGVELIDPATGAPNAPAAAEALEKTKKAGLLVGKGGLYGNVLRVAPPLSITSGEIGRGREVLNATFRN